MPVLVCLRSALTAAGLINHLYRLCTPSGLVRVIQQQAVPAEPHAAPVEGKALVLSCVAVYRSV